MTPREDLAQRCETIERAYEFMLAYAAQGLSGDHAGGRDRAPHRGSPAGTLMADSGITRGGGLTGTR